MFSEQIEQNTSRITSASDLSDLIMRHHSLLLCNQAQHMLIPGLNGETQFSVLLALSIHTEKGMSTWTPDYNSDIIHYYLLKNPNFSDCKQNFNLQLTLNNLKDV